MSKSAVVKSADLAGQPFEDSSFELTAPPDALSWKQEVNQKLAAHRTRRGVQDSGEAPAEGGVRSASSRAAEAAARVAARYAKAPSYKQLLAGEARAVVRAAGAAAEAARNAQAAAQAVLVGLESQPSGIDIDMSIDMGIGHADARKQPQPGHGVPQKTAEQAQRQQAESHTAPPRWQDEPPPSQLPMTAAELAWMEYEASQAPQTIKASPVSQQSLKPRWEETLPASTVGPAAGVGRDEWSEMRLSPAPAETEQYRSSQRGSEVSAPRRGSTEADLLHYESSDPILDATVEPVQHIAANLIEFPREIVAARKARPRQAEGPYYDVSRESPQLSIFEVDPELLAPPIYMSDVAMDVAPPEWASIQLDSRAGLRSNEHAAADDTYTEQVYGRYEQAEAALQANYAVRHQDHHETVAVPEELPEEMPEKLPEEFNSVVTGQVRESVPVRTTAMPARPAAMPARTAQRGSDNRAAAWASIAQLPDPIKMAAPQTDPAPELFVAPLSDRVLAAVVDGALVTLAFLAAATVVVASTDHPPTGKIALVASICGLLLFGMLYQYLFFSYAEEGTPGMRYARVALCSFEDDNPSREQMQKRIPAFLLSALPAGLGLAWAFIDGDSLAMHDRLTKTYQRKY